MEFESYGDILSYILKKYNRDNFLGTTMTERLSEGGKVYVFTLTITEESR